MFKRNSLSKKEIFTFKHNLSEISKWIIILCYSCIILKNPNYVETGNKHWSQINMNTVVNLAVWLYQLQRKRFFFTKHTFICSRTPIKVHAFKYTNLHAHRHTHTRLRKTHTLNKTVNKNRLRQQSSLYCLWFCWIRI